MDSRALGWRLVLVLSALLVAMEIAIVASYGTGEDATRITLRATAFTSIAAFSLAYAASALRRRWPSTATGWLVRNRRPLGLTFAVSQTIHLAAIAKLLPEMRPDEGGFVTFAFGGLAYALTYAMAATSNAPSVERLGAARWKRLHTIGMHYIAFIFAFTYSGTAAAGRVVGWVGLAALALALGLRISTRSKRAAA